MIQSFSDSDTEDIWNRRFVKKRGPELCRATRKKLVMLDAAMNINDLRVPPGNKLEGLSGDRAGQHSIRVNDQWRICFVWDDGAYDVELTDYR
ncbi:MAG: type II toxin-antitoxin system RelE/ParE family toxin [Actinomycetia bacterium]|nr:type II toxin-antitoxin system RelE/ParE family toxin [Actinomycetes bacterium]MCH9701498.1 type II toxin-antitoxin system RelE/ParE family toxin [Actinomycetes bacterium]